VVLTPEHSRSIQSLMKNAIDWGARKLAAITGTSPGARGAAVAQQHLRQVLGSLGMLVMGGKAYVGFKPGLDADGAITDDGTGKFLHSLVDPFASHVDRFAGLQRAAA
jgi:chromate reductase, NAD(P)H dehydrogenase (quinone)